MPRIGDRFVLTTSGETPSSGYSKAKRRLDALLPPDMPGWVLHDTRRTVASGMHVGTISPKTYIASACWAAAEAKAMSSSSARGRLNDGQRHTQVPSCKWKSRTRQPKSPRMLVFKPAIYSVTLSGRAEKSFDLCPSRASANPSAAMPRFSNSRIAADFPEGP